MNKLLSTRRSCDRGDVIPSVVSPIVESALCYPCLPKPFLNALCNASDGQIDVSGSVSSLRSGVCPPTVFIEVTKTAVDPVYGHADWSFSHVGHKSIKLHPFFAYGNSFGSVQRKVLAGWIKASRLHAGPYAVSPRSFCQRSSRLPMRLVRGRGSFISKASTRQNSSATERLAFCNNTISANTFTKPRVASVFLFFGNRRKSSKLLPSNINESHVKPHIFENLYNMIIAQKTMIFYILIHAKLGLASLLGVTIAK